MVKTRLERRVGARSHLPRSASALVLAGALALAGCGDSSSAPEPEQIKAEVTEPDVPEGVMLSDAVVRLPAVSGRPGVAYFTISAEGDVPRVISSVAVDGAARAEIHETREVNGVTGMAPTSEVVLESGVPVVFASGGLHVMLFGLDPALRAGTITDVTISFADGDKASIAAPVIAAGGSASGSVGEMDHTGEM